MKPFDEMTTNEIAELDYHWIADIFHQLLARVKTLEHTSLRNENGEAFNTQRYLDEIMGEMNGRS